MHPSQRPMMPGMYPHHGQMPPPGPGGHPGQPPGGFMMPAGHHHPGQQNVYPQSMYGSGSGMPPQHNMMPYPR